MKRRKIDKFAGPIPGLLLQLDEFTVLEADRAASTFSEATLVWDDKLSQGRREKARGREDLKHVDDSTRPEPGSNQALRKCFSAFATPQTLQPSERLLSLLRPTFRHSTATRVFTDSSASAQWRASRRGRESFFLI